MKDYFSTQNPATYSNSNPKASLITESLITDLIVGEGLPLRLVEFTGFVNFLNVVHPQYKPPSRQTVRKKILKKADDMKLKIMKQFQNCQTVSITVDIWSDRKMRSFLGVTAHVVIQEKEAHLLKSFTLACEQFVGRHSGENIAAAFEKIVQQFEIKNKITYIITDNAANMKKAFHTCFPSFEEENFPTLNERASTSSLLSENTHQEDVDNEFSMFTLDEADQIEVDAELETITSNIRLSCFSHSLQLVIRDRINHSKSMNLTRLSFLSTKIL